MQLTCFVTFALLATVEQVKGWNHEVPPSPSAHHDPSMFQDYVKHNVE
jgi:hypothetical protein